MGILGTVNYFNARHAASEVRDRSLEGLNKAAQDKLHAVCQVKKEQVSEYFEKCLAAN